MEFTIHNQVLTAVFVLAVILGAVANKTNFCTMGAVSDWVNMGDTGRLRAWLLAMAVAILGVAVLVGTGGATIGTETFPPYRTPYFAWLRYLPGGLMFGVGMTLASGCGNKTLVRIGGGNLKSLLVLAIAWDLPKWHQADALAGLATLVVFARAGLDVPALPWPSRTVSVPGVEISATAVRGRVAAGLPIRYWVPDPVAGFISANGLYLADA